MRILYGVVGEGMGHAVRSRVVLDYLVAQGHDLLVVVSGRAHGFLARHFEGRRSVRVESIRGLHLAFEGNVLDIGDSLWENLEQLPQNLAANAQVYWRVVESHFRPDVVVSDFDYWAYFYGRAHGVPVISIDNMGILDRCRHDPETIHWADPEYHLARAAVSVKLPLAYHYLVSTFFFLPITKPRTTLLPPILRPEILALKREPGEHVLVYQSAATNEALIPLLQSVPFPFRVYGMGREAEEGNVSLRALSEDRFLEDLRTARAVIAGGGYTLMSEVVHLGIPMLSVPIEKHFEQELNARYLAKLGYGRHARKLDAPTLSGFLREADGFVEALKGHPRQDNTYLYACLDELLETAANGEPPPPALSRAAVQAIAGRRRQGA